jgi:hypothetical protein
MSEKRDLQLLLILIFFIPLSWMVCLGWNPTSLISANDATKILYPYYPDLVSAHGDWQKVLYRPELLGGFVIQNYFGSYPITRILASLQFSPITCMNLTFLTIHILFSFFTVRITLDLARGFRSGRDRPLDSSWELFGPLLLNTFIPALSWRLSYGHPNIISGLFVFLFLFSCLLAEEMGSVTVTYLALSFVALIHCFQYQSHQLILYSVVFGAPMLVGLLGRTRPILKGVRQFGLPVVVTISAFLYSLEEFWPFFRHATSSDTARSILGQDVTYSYLTSTLMDWLSSIPWTASFLELARDHSFFFHEINYPFGPLIVLLFALSLRFRKMALPLAGGFLASVVLAVLFSMNIEPVSTLLSFLVPPLKFFRVPARSILPAIVMVPMLTSSLCLSLPPHPLWTPKNGIFFFLGAVALILPEEVREILLWISCVGLARQSFVPTQARSVKTASAGISPGVVLLVLGLSSLVAFKDRLITPFRTPEMLDSIPHLVQEQVYEKAPALKSSLTRAILDYEPEPFAFNRGYVSGISTLAGYYSPPARFLNLYYLLGEQQPEMMNQIF